MECTSYCTSGSRVMRQGRPAEAIKPVRHLDLISTYESHTLTPTQLILCRCTVWQHQRGTSYPLFTRSNANSGCSTRLLRLALPLVKTHGFTRGALAQSVLHLPPPETHTAPLSDAAISALFGHGTKAERSLVDFFFDEGIEHMKSRAQMFSDSLGRAPSVKEVLEERLKFNESVLEHLSDAFALLASSSSSVARLGPIQVPPVDPLPSLKHALKVADEACYLSGDTSTEVWVHESLACLYALNLLLPAFLVCPTCLPRRYLYGCR